MKPIVVLGLLGIRLDAARHATRWERWRPSVALCRHEELVINRFELLTPEKYRPMAERVSKDMGTVSPETEVRIHELDFDDPWDFEEVYARLHDFAREYPFDPEREDYLVHMTTGTHVAQICLFLLTESRHLPARLLQSSPPGRGHPEDPGEFDIIDLDLSRYDRLASRFKKEVTEGLSFLKSGIETRNRDFNTLIARIEKVAISSSAPILLTGPTGAGKSQLARRIYELRKLRRQVAGEFVEVNCATLRGDAAMSALFGHVKGAFTGALADRPGLLKAANGGVLLLDEIGELGLDEQAMLLRALEEGRFLPVGADREAESDFRLIAGTNRDLAREVVSGGFREDLLARINLWTFELPGLADRTEDIEPNLEYELEQWAQKEGTRVSMNREARRRFLKFATSPRAAWKGNFRDFNAAVVRMATLAGGGRIDEGVVAEEIDRLVKAWRTPRSGKDEDLLGRYLDQEAIARLDRFDRVQLADVLSVCASARTLSEAGRALFQVSRANRSTPNDADRLRKYLSRHGLSWRQITGTFRQDG